MAEVKVSEKKSIIHSDKDLPQGSDSWRRSRLASLGSSEVACILNLNPYKSCEELYLEKIGELIPEDISNKYVVKRGTALEPVARNIVNQTLERDFQPVVFEYKEFNAFKYSSDGYDENYNEIIEIKCLGDKNHQKCIDLDGPLEYYMPQIVWGLMLSEAVVCHYVCYNPKLPDPIFIKSIYPDQKQFDHILEMATKFWECVTTKTKPTW